MAEEISRLSETVRLGMSLDATDNEKQGWQTTPHVPSLVPHHYDFMMASNHQETEKKPPRIAWYFSNDRNCLPVVVSQFEKSPVVTIHTSPSANKQKNTPMIRKYVGIQGRMTRSANGNS
jgi:hypothetical protein